MVIHTHEHISQPEGSAARSDAAGSDIGDGQVASARRREREAERKAGRSGERHVEATAQRPSSVAALAALAALAARSGSGSALLGGGCRSNAGRRAGGAAGSAALHAPRRHQHLDILRSACWHCHVEALASGHLDLELLAGTEPRWHRDKGARGARLGNRERRLRHVGPGARHVCRQVR